MPQLTPDFVVGTWTSTALTNFDGKDIVGLGVLQFHSNHTFIEGVDLAGNLAAYSGVWFFDPNSQKIAYQITSESGSPPANPFNTPALSSTVAVGGGPATVRMNNDLLFTMKSTSVNLSDFTLPSPPTPNPRPGPTHPRGAIAMTDDSGHMAVMPLAHHSGD